MNQLKAVIFDLDGTLLDNNQIHLESWKVYLKKMGLNISDEDYKANISGRTNHDAVEHIFHKKMTKEQTESYYLEKEKIYRELYAPIIKPVDGLIDLLEELQNANIIMAIATSGIQVNIDFMFDHVPIKKYFMKIVNSTHIKNGKPDPEIFETTAKMIETEPKNCIVFEDSTAGVEAAISAGMKVIALTTTHTERELHRAEKVIKDFTQINYNMINSLFID